MKIGGETSFPILALASMFCICSAIFFKKNDDEDKPSLLFNHKPLTIFSRPDSHADKNTAPGLIPHLGTVLHGGSIGIEFQPLGFVHGILGHAKKVIPGSKETVGQPSHEKPPKNDHWEEGQDWEFEKPKKEANKEWEPEEEKPGKYKPDKPVGPSWDDIGEKNPDEDGTDIIQPRLRPKRFIESKIYHVPLLYRSNGRPYLVKIKNRNDLDEFKSENFSDTNNDCRIRSLLGKNFYLCDDEKKENMGEVNFIFRDLILEHAINALEMNRYFSGVAVPGGGSDKVELTRSYFLVLGDTMEIN